MWPFFCAVCVVFVCLWFCFFLKSIFEVVFCLLFGLVRCFYFWNMFLLMVMVFLFCCFGCLFLRCFLRDFRLFCAFGICSFLPIFFWGMAGLNMACLFLFAHVGFALLVYFHALVIF